MQKLGPQDPSRVAHHLKFSIGIPVFNEESILIENTLRLCRYLDRLEPYEVLIGINGSTDRSSQLGHELATQNPRIRMFEIPERKVGAIFQTFLQQANSEYLISLDMDLSTDLEFIPQALELLRNNDLVIGSKKMGNQSRSWVRRLGSALYIYCARGLLNLGAEDYSMGAKAYRISFFREFAQGLGEGTTYVVNCIYFARLYNAKIVEIPVSCEDFRRSKFSLTREALEKYSHLLWLWWRHRAKKGKVGGAPSLNSELLTVQLRSRP